MAFGWIDENASGMNSLGRAAALRRAERGGVGPEPNAARWSAG